ncbi:hypothetical protein ESCO_005882 [Escovopsis weberi]|uniref:Xylanolytic transcriptional activator regulatory domain-containing protein n=1 Tax=Escovopsis weberi TaxID=150374 RepID=A0A0M8N086_ESCWE|nr:hypothetical protein ESCO_005882 [Escovopsis weberi]
MWQHAARNSSSSIPSSPEPTALQETTPSHLLRTTSTSPVPIDLFSTDIAGDAFIERYYKCFHRCHPCVLPRSSLERFMQYTSSHAELKALISVMRYTGSLYLPSARQPSQRGSISRQLDEIASAAISCAVSASSAASSSSSFWLLAQSHLIYSIGKYWQGHPEASRQHLDAAIRLVLEHRMFCREYAVEHGRCSPVLQECLRRTWWQIYIVDASHAAIKRQSSFALISIQPTADLPCEEDEYDSGSIPPPKTLEEFDAREFAPDDAQFSSFAYLVGAIRSMATAISRAYSITDASSDYSPITRSPKFLEEVDALIHGWMLLVPETKSHVLTKNGEVDELLFYGYMALHATSAGLHRSFSECHVNPLEDMSSCSSPHVKDCQARGLDLTDGSPFTRVHTARCIEAAEAQIRMLSFPARPTSHSPFTVCMLTTGTLSLLAACKFILRGEKLAVARDQIRASIGYHRAMAGMWAQAKTNLGEIQEIARTVLAIDAAKGDVREETTPPMPTAGIAADQLADPAVSNPYFITLAQETSLSMDDAQIWSAAAMQVPMDMSCWWPSEPEMMNS